MWSWKPIGRTIQPLARRVSRTPLRWFAAARGGRSSRRLAERVRLGEPEERTCDGHCRQRIEVGESRPVAGQCSAIAPRGAAPSSALVACALAAHGASEALAFAAHAPWRGRTGASRAERSPKKSRTTSQAFEAGLGDGPRRDARAFRVRENATREPRRRQRRRHSRPAPAATRRTAAGRARAAHGCRASDARSTEERERAGSARARPLHGCSRAEPAVVLRPRRRRRCPSTDGARRPRTTGSSSTCCRASWCRCRGCARRASCCRPSRRARA